MPARTVLILGGTREARALAELLAGADTLRVITSLAGRTSVPAPVAGEMRRGGFGGAAGLAAFLAREKVSAVADATHPFAAEISRHAAAACARLDLPYLRLQRPAWEPRAGDDWRPAGDIAAAAVALAPGARAFVTVGRQEIAPFLARRDVTIVARMIDPPDGPVPDHAQIVLARPPFSLEEEVRLLARHGIGVLVCKNSGGEATRAKLDAARARGIPVIMVARPRKPAAPGAATAERLAHMIRDLFGA